MAGLTIFVALGGSSYAALKVTGRDVVDGSLTGKDLRDGSVRSSDVARLGAGDISPGELRSGAAGATGPAGGRGAPGAPGGTGLRGAPGRDGDSGESLRWEGGWSADRAYAPGDVVFRDGSSYRAQSDPPAGDAPEGSPHWQLLAGRGAAGEFAGDFVSPGGHFTVSVQNSGIVLQGPSARAEVTGSGAALHGAAGSALADGSGVKLSGALVSVGNGTTCKSFAQGGAHTNAGMGWFPGPPPTFAPIPIPHTHIMPALPPSLLACQ
jgi:hypothetical protein